MPRDVPHLVEFLAQMIVDVDQVLPTACDVSEYTAPAGAGGAGGRVDSSHTVRSASRVPSSAVGHTRNPPGDEELDNDTLDDGDTSPSDPGAEEPDRETRDDCDSAPVAGTPDREEDDAEGPAAAEAWSSCASDSAADSGAVATLAGMVQDPNGDNPREHAKAAQGRRDIVLNDMLAQHMINPAQHAKAIATKVNVTGSLPKQDPSHVGTTAVTVEPGTG